MDPNNDDKKRIDQEDFSLGIGIVISEVISDYYEEHIKDNNNLVTFYPLKEGEETTLEGKMEEIQTICKNEGFNLVATKYFIPLNPPSDQYHSYTNYEFAIIKKLDYNDAIPTDFINKNIEILMQILKYFKLDYHINDKIDRLNYYIFFPENTIINDDGKSCGKIAIESEWEHQERCGEHID